jgi:hypothetical protein
MTAFMGTAWVLLLVARVGKKIRLNVYHAKFRSTNKIIKKPHDLIIGHAVCYYLFYLFPQILDTARSLPKMPTTVITKLTRPKTTTGM